jgi:hypothetical protein
VGSTPTLFRNLHHLEWHSGRARPAWAKCRRQRVGVQPLDELAAAALFIGSIPLAVLG